MKYSTVSLKHDLRYGGCSLFKRGCLSPGYAKVSYLSPVFVLVGGVYFPVIVVSVPETATAEGAHCMGWGMFFKVLRKEMSAMR
jgi:hypothetical protein